ncbi:MAG: hypothetical protein M1831_004951 [Alyxoria varia]|nr:MAG: hypothetical protein M1831_004951 [Alyxoria varia]
MGSIEGLYIFDERNQSLLEHVYSGRPPLAATLLSSYLALSTPRPSFTRLQNISSSALLFAHVHDPLLLLCYTTTEIEPLLVFEFLQRAADALEDFLGFPLIASKIESNYDVVAQIVEDMCDAGIVCSTEPNALRETVEVPTWMSNLLGGIGLPASSPALTRPGSGSSLQSGFGNNPNLGGAGGSSAGGSAIPWRRSNVRHTSNELYVDIVERLSVILAPSGQPLAAFAHGTLAFTAKISGIPDLLLTLSAAGGRAGILNAMALPSFHPCIRLARWRDNPGTLSFVPPDGRFILATYECDLLPDLFNTESVTDKIPTPNVKLPASIQIRPSLGALGDEIEVHLTLPLNNSSNPSSAIPSRSNSSTGRFGSSLSGGQLSGSILSSTGPAVEDVLVTIPFPSIVKNVTDFKCSKGEAHMILNEGIVEWRIPTREAATLGTLGATMRCTVVGSSEGSNDESSAKARANFSAGAYDYDEEIDGSYQANEKPTRSTQNHADKFQNNGDKTQPYAHLMPQSANLSFSVKGWLASGIKVDSLNINTQTSKGLGAGVSPYKGVKYHTVSQQGIEVRC